MLRSLFTRFDQCCLDLNLYKLYTIGDCYVVMGIINANERNVEEEVNWGLKIIYLLYY